MPGSPLTEGHHGETLNLGNTQIRISLADDLQAPVRMTQKLCLQTKVRAKAIQCEGRAHQLLVGGRDPRKTSIQVGQELTTIVKNTDAPGA